MKFHFKEATKIDYSGYEFPYKVYATREESDSIDALYRAGFLQTRIRKDYYYMARGVRVDLAKFELNSENRRILKKTEYMEVELVDLDKFEYDYTIGKFAKEYYDSRFGPKTMSAERVKWIFTGGAFTHTYVVKDRESGNVVGYCPVLMTDETLHYAYPFYNAEYFERNLGMGMMVNAIQSAKEKGLKYVYLGTCYNHSSLYKTQFDGIEWFNGEGWSSDVEALKMLCKS